MLNLSLRVYKRLKRTLFPSALGAICFKVAHPLRRRFACPICNYHGPFLHDSAITGRTLHTHCPKCGSNVRMRLQWLTMEKLRKDYDFSEIAIHHFSPEKAMGEYLKEIFGNYFSAGLTEMPVDCPADLTDLPFDDCSCDCIFASHVLEHIQDDEKALSEIARVLKQGGIAILPVPIIQKYTIEYPEPNQNESGHVRAPGPDYFDKYRKVFSMVEIYKSEDFNPKYQLYHYVDLTHYPAKESPHRHPVPGYRHSDYVPVCFI